MFCTSNFDKRPDKNLMTVKQTEGAVHFRYVKARVRREGAKVKYFTLVIRIAAAK